MSFINQPILKKATSYFIELLIVVVGVSIAFQLSVWKEDRKNDEIEKNLLQNFLTENILNQNEFDSMIFSIRETIGATSTLIELLKDSQGEEDSIRENLAILYQIVYPDITTTHLDNYLDYTTANSQLKEEMLVLKTNYESVRELGKFYGNLKQQKYFDFLSDVIDLTGGLVIVNKKKLFSVKFRNNLFLVLAYEQSMEGTFSKILVGQKKVTELISDRLTQ
jgi:hypothetical protein